MKRPCVIRREIRAGRSRCHISRLYGLSEMIFKKSNYFARDSKGLRKCYESLGQERADLSVLWRLNPLGAWKCVYTTDG